MAWLRIVTGGQCGALWALLALRSWPEGGGGIDKIYVIPAASTDRWPEGAGYVPSCFAGLFSVANRFVRRMAALLGYRGVIDEARTTASVADFPLEDLQGWASSSDTVLLWLADTGLDEVRGVLSPRTQIFVAAAGREPVSPAEILIDVRLRGLGADSWV